MLGLGQVSNKVDAVKRWLSRPENSGWLLIFDNADDLKSVGISRYYPSSSGGHILITSRDQAAIGNVARHGCLLERLDVQDAIAVLLEKAGIEEPSAEDREQAERIVDLLGCLPLAVNQGGAFLRSRRKGLADYRRLYDERQNDILRYKPRLEEYEKTVLTAWEINFKQIEREAPEASNLLLLMCFLEQTSISELMLVRGCSPQKRWNRRGEIDEPDAVDSGIDSSLVELVKNEVDFSRAIDTLLSFSLISVNDDPGSRIFSLHPLVQYCASQRVSSATQRTWRLQATLLVCHAFPRSKYLDPLWVLGLLRLHFHAKHITGTGNSDAHNSLTLIGSLTSMIEPPKMSLGKSL